MKPLFSRRVKKWVARLLTRSAYHLEYWAYIMKMKADEIDPPEGYPMTPDIPINRYPAVYGGCN